MIIDVVDVVDLEECEFPFPVMFISSEISFNIDVQQKGEKFSLIIADCSLKLRFEWHFHRR